MAKTKPLTIEEVLTILRHTPPKIAALTKDLTSNQWRTPPIESEWSLNEVLAHLRSCSDMWGDNMVRIINDEHPTFAAINPTTWSKQTDYPDWEFHPSFEVYATQRVELLKVLESLSPQGWERTATVTVWGKEYERTVLYYVQWMARHERSHIRPMRRAVESLTQKL